MTDQAHDGKQDLPVVPVRHFGRYVAALVVLVIAFSAIWSVVHNSQFQWNIVGEFLTTRTVLDGLVLTLELTVLAMAVGVVGGTLLAVMRLSPNPIVSGASWLYIWFFRGTPVLMQILFWYNFSALYPTISIGIPFGPTFVHASANSLITKLIAGVFGLGFNEAAYMAEIVRAGILSVDEGQNEASASLGMRRLQMMRRIVLPQAMRVIIPPTGNEVISMLKTTSLVIVIALSDLMGATSNIAASNYNVIQLLIVAGIWYLSVTSVLYVGQFFLERHFGRGSRTIPETQLQRAWRYLRPHAPPTPQLAIGGPVPLEPIERPHP